MKEIIDNLNKEYQGKNLWIADYNGGNDSGGIDSYNEELLTKVGIKDHWLFLNYLENNLLNPIYYSYAFEGSCNGSIYYNGEEFIMEGQESYEEWKDVRNSFKPLEDV